MLLDTLVAEGLFHVAKRPSVCTIGFSCYKNLKVLGYTPTITISRVPIDLCLQLSDSNERHLWQQLAAQTTPTRIMALICTVRVASPFVQMPIFPELRHLAFEFESSPLTYYNSEGSSRASRTSRPLSPTLLVRASTWLSSLSHLSVRQRSAASSTSSRLHHC